MHHTTQRNATVLASLPQGISETGGRTNSCLEVGNSNLQRVCEEERNVAEPLRWGHVMGKMGKRMREGVLVMLLTEPAPEPEPDPPSAALCDEMSKKQTGWVRGYEGAGKRYEVAALNAPAR